MREPTDFDDDFIPNEPGLDAAQEAAKREYDEIVTAFKDTFKTQAGKKVLRYLKETYHDIDTHVPGDPHTSAYRNGCRGLYLAIHKTVEE